jgi:hypothetical protein
MGLLRPPIPILFAMGSQRIMRWLLAIVGRAPMGLREALVLVVAGGAVVLTVILGALIPEPPDPLALWLLWWAVVAASAALFLRGLVGIFGVAGERVAGAWLVARERLPVEFRSPVIRKPRATVPDPPRGFLDFEKAALRATNRMSKILQEMTRDNSAMTATLNHYTPRFEAATEASIDRRLGLSREFASKLHRHARKTEAQEVDLRHEGEEMATNYLKRIEWFPPEKDLTELRGHLAQLRETTTESRTSASGYRAAVVDMRKINIEASVNAAADRLVAALTNVVSDFDRTVRFTTDALKMIDSRKSPQTRQTSHARRAQRPSRSRSRGNR